VTHASTIDSKNCSAIDCIINASCDFNYEADKLTLKFQSSKSWQPKALKVSFLKKSLTSIKFGDDVDAVKPNEIFTQDVSFHTVSIDFFGFSTERTFSIVFDIQQFKTSTLRSSFTITLPVIEQKELCFTKPKVILPDPVTQCMCEQNFEMDASNSVLEIQRCIDLEEFRMLPVQDRFKSYGYNVMLEQFIHIEDNFEISSVRQLNLDNAKVVQTGAINYKIDVSNIKTIFPTFN
jgi:hypothetical protein